MRMTSFIRWSIGALLGISQLAHAESGYLYTYTGANYDTFIDATFGNPNGIADSPFHSGQHFTFSFVTHSALTPDTNYKWGGYPNLGLSDELLGWKSENGVRIYLGTDTDTYLGGYIATGASGAINEWNIGSGNVDNQNLSNSAKIVTMGVGQAVFDRVGEFHYLPQAHWNQAGSTSIGSWSSAAIAQLPEWALPYNPITPVPEPATYGMLAAGLVMLGFMMRRGKTRARTVRHLEVMA